MDVAAAVLPLLVAFAAVPLLELARLDEALHRHPLVVVRFNIQIPVVPAQPVRRILVGLPVHHILALPPLRIREERLTSLTEMSESTGISRCTAIPSVQITSVVQFMAVLVLTMQK